jgi:hypothetical protein
MSSETPPAENEKAAHNGNEVVETPDDTPRMERDVTGILWFIVNVAVLSATFLYALDNTVMANVRPSVIESFGNRVDTLAWLSISYPMGEVGSNPLWCVYFNWDNFLYFDLLCF